MAYFAEIEVGYYETDDTYYGPFEDACRIEASSIPDAVRHAQEFLQQKMAELHKAMPVGHILRIRDEAGKLRYGYPLGVLRTICIGYDPPPALIEISNQITVKLISYLKKHPDKMYELRPRQFEELIAEILAGYGWEVQLTPQGGFAGSALKLTIKRLRGHFARRERGVFCSEYRLQADLRVFRRRRLHTTQTRKGEGGPDC